jgi:hypothetical protein
VLNYLLSGEERERTAVIGHIYQEVCDPRGFELVDCIRNIKLELYWVPTERADKHLTTRGTLSDGNAEVTGIRTTPVLFPGKMNDLMTPVLPLVGVRVGRYKPGRSAVLA